MTEITACRLCQDSGFLREVIDLGEMAFTGIFPKSADEKVPTGRLRLLKCGACGLVQNDRRFPPDVLFGPTYGYRSGLNAAMIAHLATKPAQLARFATLEEGDVVLDIGSSDGTLLRAFAVPGNLQLIGFDPQAYRFRELYPRGAAGVAQFFSEAKFKGYCQKPAKIITSIAMFYDLEDPVDFARQVAACLHPEGVWHLEVAYGPAMVLHNNAFDAICHEHIEYYGFDQLRDICKRAGLKILDYGFNDVNGGSVNITAAREEHPMPGLGIGPLPDTPSLEDWEVFNAKVKGVIGALQNFVRTRPRGEIVCGLGASTKGNVLLQALGLTPKDIPMISDVNPDKWGCVTPGTHIPIVPEAKVRELNPDYLLVLPWHFRAGIIEREQEYLERGGALVFPLPEFEIVSKDNPAQVRKEGAA